MYATETEHVRRLAQTATDDDSQLRVESNEEETSSGEVGTSDRSNERGDNDHRVRTFVCNVCNKVCGSAGALGSHSRIHRS